MATGLAGIVLNYCHVIPLPDCLFRLVKAQKPIKKISTGAKKLSKTVDLYGGTGFKLSFCMQHTYDTTCFV